MYFSAIQFIYDVKRGPFWEHSPVLYDISGIKDGWAKINKGMLKMYAAEVLGKFPVVQHFPFGSLFRWESDPEAGRMLASVHVKEQPRSMDVPPPPAGDSAGTKAPWAKSGMPMMPPVQASSGVPSTRAPAGASSRQPAAAAPPMAPTAAPWASNQTAPAGSTRMPPPTTAPWTEKNGG
jgi:serine/threonine-protein phosphatase 2A activator